MKVYSYVVARDYGFAPNPFHGVCTLATCKPQIRRTAQVGDWVIGTGAKPDDRDGQLVYAMRIAETLTYEQYWNDERFRGKRPNLRGSLKQAYGDNIYHRDTRTGKWLQEDSHHSLPDGRANRSNVDHDTKVSRVLIGTEYKYWGPSGPRVPTRFRQFRGYDVCCTTQGHKCNFPNELVRSFVEWIQSIRDAGYMGEPAGFGDHTLG